MRFKEFRLLEAKSDPEVVKQQEKLRDLGYDLGPYGIKGDGVDGIIGPYTQTAIDAFSKGIAPKDAPKPNKDAVSAFNSQIGFTPNSSSHGLPVNGRISSPFGHRTSVGAAHNHLGTDFAVPTGTPIKAPAAGVIKSAGNNGGGEGIFVILDAGRVVHKFFHLSKVSVRPGQKVEQGDIVGLTGNTGYSTGPHLHWETHIAGRPVDPIANIG
jgi:murein DD-endopeptidase MepM/ murein hydrolase activator NlpD